MPLSMYQVSVPVFQQLLESLSAVLEKAEAHCETTGAQPADMLALRLAPDMFTLTQQVQRACIHASGAVARLASIDVPEEADDEEVYDADDLIVDEKDAPADEPEALDDDLLEENDDDDLLETLDEDEE